MIDLMTAQIAAKVLGHRCQVGADVVADRRVANADGRYAVPCSQL